MERELKEKIIDYLCSNHYQNKFPTCPRYIKSNVDVDEYTDLFFEGYYDLIKDDDEFKK